MDGPDGEEEAQHVPVLQKAEDIPGLTAPLIFNLQRTHYRVNDGLHY